MNKITFKHALLSIGIVAAAIVSITHPTHGMVIGIVTNLAWIWEA